MSRRSGYLFLSKIIRLHSDVTDAAIRLISQVFNKFDLHFALYTCVQLTTA